jgi:hypothetical protein
MKRLLVSLVIVGSLAGCFASRPQGNAGFVRARTLHQLEGVYANFGEGAANEAPPYLSKLMARRKRVR